MNRLAPFAGGMVCAVVLSVPALAADEGSLPHACAVSTFNGKFEGAGGYFEDDGSGADGRGHGALSFTMPLGCELGFQLDTAFGTLGGREAGGVGAHLFTRDPSRYLFGAYASYSAIDNFTTTNDIFRVGAEGEFYLEQFSFEGVAGYEDADFGSKDWFGQFTAAFYATDNVRVSAGYRHFLSVDAGVASVEWQPQGLGVPVSLFVEGQVGSNSYASVFGGFRFHFGAGDKSLKRRHREDDPGNLLMNLLATTCTGMFPASSSSTDGVIDDGTHGATKIPVSSPYTDTCGNSVGSSSVSADGLDAVD
ncbi:MAG: hypothetical protein AAGF81_15335 [Pseudomonadota bacterium]